MSSLTQTNAIIPLKLTTSTIRERTLMSVHLETFYSVYYKLICTCFTTSNTHTQHHLTLKNILYSFLFYFRSLDNWKVSMRPLSDPPQLIMFFPSLKRVFFQVPSVHYKYEKETYIISIFWKNNLQLIFTKNYDKNYMFLVHGFSFGLPW
ncbi:hypothetical protein ACJX0J_005687, partial [Zea mays]